MTFEPPTPRELEKLELFRERVCKIYPEKDETLLRWLRARDLDIVKAEQMLRRHLIWRKNNDIEELKLWRSPKIFLPYLHSGYDKEGAPIYIMPVGHWDMRANIENGNIVPSMRFIYQTLENVIETAQSQNIYQGVIIMDFDGFAYRQIANRTVIQGILEVLKIFELNYPEVLKTAFVINTPTIFNYLFAIVAPLLNSRTLSKAQIYGPNRRKWQEIIFKTIDPDQLPPHWGGTKQGSDEFCSDSWFGKCLPPNYLKKCGAHCDEFGAEWFTTRVPAREKLVFEYQVDEDMSCPMLKWGFSTDGYDIGFSVQLEDEILVEYERVEAHDEKREGELRLEKSGKYSIIFDNTYSRTRGKTLHYSISLNEEDEFHDFDSPEDSSLDEHEH